jgi:hypothetical protein
LSSPWDALVGRPRFCFTSDQDWAPEWALEELLDWVRARGIPLHVFRTSASEVLDEAVQRGEITQGWHPNLAPTSSHGSSVEEVVGWFQENFPGGISVRGHGFNESYAAWSAFAHAGIEYDSQFPAAFSGHLVPAVHATGIVRMPVFLEDDLWLGAFPGRYTPDVVLDTLFAPGLKILNIHAAHLALNTPSLHAYRAAASMFYESRGPGRLIHGGDGTRTMIDALAGAIDERGNEFEPFEAICREASSVIASTSDLAIGSGSTTLR